MYSDLPDSLKKNVLDRLMANDFKTAKQIHDQWMAKADKRFMHSQSIDFDAFGAQSSLANYQLA